MLLEDYLKNKSLEQIQEELPKAPYYIHVVEDGTYFLLKYNQFDSDFGNPVVRLCRGVIIRKDTLKVVCRPFDKFFNYSEPNAAEIDWSSAKVLEKIDGSIIKVWHDAGSWRISTNGVIDAKKSINPLGKSFYDMFIEAFNNTVGQNFEEWALVTLSPEYTYMFELMHPENRIIIRPDKPAIYHIGTRHTGTGKELPIGDLGVPTPKTYAFNNIKDVLDMAKSLTYDNEGYVVVDRNWNRIKIKGPAYVAAAHLKGNSVVTYKRVISLIMRGEHEEFLSYFPEFTVYFDKAEKAYLEYIKRVTDFADKLSKENFPDRKSYAAYVRSSPNPDFFFKVKDGKYAATEICKYIQDHAEKTADPATNEPNYGKLVEILNLPNEEAYCVEKN